RDHVVHEPEHVREQQRRDREQHPDEDGEAALRLRRRDQDADGVGARAREGGEGVCEQQHVAADARRVGHGGGKEAVETVRAAAILALLAGLAGSVQVAVMGRFGDRIGVVAALAFATGVQLLLATTLLLLTRRTGGIGEAFRSPPWMWVGGAMGLLVVFSITF